jgi:ribosomal protein S6
MNGVGLSHKSRISKHSPDSRTASFGTTRHMLNLSSVTSIKKHESSLVGGLRNLNSSMYTQDMGNYKLSSGIQKNQERRLPLIVTDKFSVNSSIVSSNNSTLKLNESIHRIHLLSHDEDVRTAWPSPKVSARTPSQSSFIQITEPTHIWDSLQIPVSPATALKLFASSLTSYEQSEILEYNQIYWLGLKAKKIRTDMGTPNYGFDDDRSDYKLVQGDHIAYRYEILQLLGKGSFGQVCKCYDHKKGDYVAIKIIRNQRRFHRQGKVEVRVLKHIIDHDYDDQGNMIHMLNYFQFRNHLVIAT